MPISSTQSGGVAIATQQVTNNSGAERKVGDILAMQVVGGGATMDGKNATLPVVAGATPEGVLARFGAIRHADTDKTYADGAVCFIQDEGLGKARVNGASQNIAAGDILVATNGSDMLTTVATQPNLAGDAPTVTTVGSNGATSGAGLSNIGATNSGDVSGAIMSDLKALQEDIAALRTIVQALLEVNRAVAIAQDASTSSDELIDVYFLKRS